MASSDSQINKPQCGCPKRDGTWRVGTLEGEDRGKFVPLGNVKIPPKILINPYLFGDPHCNNCLQSYYNHNFKVFWVGC